LSVTKCRNFQQSAISILLRKCALGVFSASLLASCGGGGSSPTASDTSQISAVKRGQFIDSPVAGVSYQTSQRSGLTDAEGYFEYDTDGETVTFALAGNALGSAAASSVVHVLDIKTDSSFGQEARGQRVAQLLQTLDEDRNPSNGIQISDVTRAMLLTRPKIDFDSEAANWEGGLASMVAGTGKSVVALDKAIAHARANAPQATNCPISATTFP
jgi:hypothetical protein